MPIEGGFAFRASVIEVPKDAEVCWFRQLSSVRKPVPKLIRLLLKSILLDWGVGQLRGNGQAWLRGRG